MATVRFNLRKGLDIPLTGSPAQVIEAGAKVGSVALLGADYVGLRPSLSVEVGEPVKLGQTLFCDRRIPELRFTSPGAGVVDEISRGRRRALRAVVIRLSGSEEVRFPSHEADRLSQLSSDQIVDNLLASGLWTALRERPFNRVANPQVAPAAIFVTAMDSNPMAVNAELVVHAHRQAFEHGLTVISRLKGAHVFLCREPGAAIPDGGLSNVTVAEFAGPHPAGLAGTHIHFLHPVSRNKAVWHIGYQDLIAVGKLFTTGRLWVDRIVSLAGPSVQRPRLIRSRLGANIGDLIESELHAGRHRVVSGSVLSGRAAQGQNGYLGRYHQHLSVLGDAGATAEDHTAAASADIYSITNALWPGMNRSTGYRLSTALHGKPKAMIPIGSFERVMPLDILPTQLLRALLIGDTEAAEALGCLELDEEDLGLCTFVCPSKCEYGVLLRECLDRIERES